MSSMRLNHLHSIMAKVVSPGAFALLQQGRVIAIWSAAMLVVGGALTAIFAYFFVPTPAEIAAFLILVLALGGTAWGYMAWSLASMKAGLVSTPRKPWGLRVDGDVLTIATARYITSVPLGSIKSATLVQDDSWETLRGMESACLVLRLDSNRRISIPRSSTGFKELVAAIRRLLQIDTISV